MKIFAQIIDLLSSDLGGMAYHLIFSFYLLNIWRLSTSRYRHTKLEEDKQALFAVSGMLIVQSILFVVAIMAVGNTYLKGILPVLDRAAGLLISIGVIWLWKVPVKGKSTKSFAISAVVLALLALLPSILWWGANGDIGMFEGSLLNRGWNIATILVLSFGLVSLLRPRDQRVPIGIAMLSILLLGEIVQSIVFLDSSYPILTRLSQIITFPMLMAIIKPYGKGFENSVSSVGVEDVLSFDETLISNANNQDRVKIHSEPNQTLITIQEQALEIGNLEEELSKQKSELDKFTGFADEIRQPVTSISKYTELLLSESAGSLGASQKKFLGNVKTSISNISEIVSSLVQITSKNASEFQFQPEIIDFNDVIDEVMAQTRKSFQDRNLILRINMPQSLPPLFSHKVVLEKLIVQILNHVQQLTDAGGEIFLNIGEDFINEEQCVFIDVRGGGQISEEEIERFLSAEDFSSNYPEIFLAKELISLVGGELKVTNEGNLASTYSVYFPTKLVISELQVE